ncbi:MAG: nucleoside 2-deoxyribosyltransferase [Actinomycetia bacterium]|nr:nucleoside 2-deoxyribosyltransferase [Actinomycetes bacterium]
MKKVYIAGPLFDEGERWWIESVEKLVADAGFTTFLPHRDNPPKDQFNVRTIFENDKRGIDECDLVVANLNGVITDDGTAWELGYAYARGKHLIGLHTDWRQRFPDEVVNLMLECSLHRLVRSLDDLRLALAEYGESGS